jgi:RHS repeat-associated protein
MRKIIIIIILYLFTINSFSQAHIWEVTDLKIKIITLSKGKYQEFHDIEDVVEIGSVLYNTQTKKIIGFVGKDTLYNEIYLKPHIISRWISPDPLSEEYSSWSPYNYTMNNPILFVDPDGRYVDWYLNLEKGNIEHREGSESHFDEGLIHLAADDASVGDIESSLAEKGYEYQKDASVSGGFSVDTESAYKGWTMMQIYSPGNVGTVLLLASSNFGASSKGAKKFGEKIVTNTAKTNTQATIQLTKSKFGHTFARHGEDATSFLVNRAKGSGMAQGQFLDNQKAAKFIMDNVGKTTKGAVNIPIPKGFPARVIMPDGSFKAASHIRLIPGGSGVKTAYPLIP